ncbi:MAG: Plug domain-containing protein [Caulobacteraceae bacterium]
MLGTSRQDTTRLESTAPIDVISSQQLIATGAKTLNQALEKLNPSFNFPQGQNSWNGQNTRSASLKGVSPAYTLILVNGKRRNPSSQITNHPTISGLHLGRHQHHPDRSDRPRGDPP